MKKGFTMIELIFVIVILGILASVAIPRLAATKADAEISAAVANLRTLISDANAYYTVKGSFPANTKWNEITNVPLANADTAASAAASAADDIVSLKVGDKSCINVKLANKGVNKQGVATPAHILIGKHGTNKDSGICKQVLNSEPLKPYFTSTVKGVAIANGVNIGAIAIGSSTNIY